jgi:hypothetical protein
MRVSTAMVLDVCPGDPFVAMRRLLTANQSDRG